MYLLEMLRKTLSKKYVLNVTNLSRVKRVLKFIMEEYIELKNTFRQAIINLKISKVHPKKN
jgi:hypothetical protein